jgi:hypothetical protein
MRKKMLVGAASAVAIAILLAKGIYVYTQSKKID